MTPRTFAPLIALALGLAACAEVPNPPSAGLDVPKVLQVRRQQFQYEAAFAPGSSVLTPAEQARLENFLTRGAPQSPPHVYVSASANDPLATARIARIVNLLAARGIDVERAAPPPSGMADNHLLVVLRRYVVQQPVCPDWSGDPDYDHQNFPASNFGCANVVNLGMMVDDPRDLVQGRTLGPESAEPGLEAINRYRTDTVKALPVVSASGNTGGGGGGASGGGGSTSASSSSGQ